MNPPCHGGTPFVAREFAPLWRPDVPCVPLRSVSARECSCVPEMGVNKFAGNLAT